MEQEDIKWEISLMCLQENKTLRTEGQISHKCLIYRKLIMLGLSFKRGSWSGVTSYQPQKMFAYGFQRHEQEMAQGGLISQNNLK